MHVYVAGHRHLERAKLEEDRRAQLPRLPQRHKEPAALATAPKLEEGPYLELALPAHRRLIGPHPCIRGYSTHLRVSSKARAPQGPAADHVATPGVPIPTGSPSYRRHLCCTDKLSYLLICTHAAHVSFCTQFQAGRPRSNGIGRIREQSATQVKQAGAANDLPGVRPSRM